MDRREKFDRLQVALQTINRSIRGGFFEQGAHPITRVQWMILQILWRRGDCTIGELAELMDVRSSTMSQMVDRLEKADLAHRTQSPSDSRSRLVALTDEGRSLIRRVQSAWMQKLAEPLEKLSEDEQVGLILLLEKLAEQFPKKTD